MERSQSCSSFEPTYLYNNLENDGVTSHNVNNHNNSGNKDKNTGIQSTMSHNLRKAIEWRKTEHDPQLAYSGSNEDASHVLLQPQHQPQPPVHLSHLSVVSMDLRKKTPLQLEMSIAHTDDTEYAADFDEDEDEEDNDDDDAQKIMILQSLPKPSPMLHTTTLIIDTSVKHISNGVTLPYPSKMTNRTAAIANPSLRLMLSKSSFDSPSTSSSSMTPTTSGTMESSITTPPTCRRQLGQLKRDNSLQSDSSRYSSVDSLLDSRKADPEAILINLGFGPVGTEDILSRIPKRFLGPSQVRGIDTDAFVKRLQLAHTLADHSVLGYRGLTGNPDVPPSSIVAKIMERFEVNERKKSMGSIEHTIR